MMGIVRSLLMVGALFSVCLAAQTVVVDRAISAAPSASTQAVEREGGGFFGDTFRIGAAQDVWKIDAIRVWVAKDTSATCPAKLGDQISKITLLGALENTPVPGEPECRCHALIPVRSAAIEKGGDRSVAPNVKITSAGAFWQVDFLDVRWSLPGDTTVLYAVRATAGPSASCKAAQALRLSASPADAGYRLRRFDKDLVPEGPADVAAAPKWFNVQVRAHKDD
ncbi:MAG: hypothetical protein JWP63_5138 [Candidatus Solibacter sp.]|jgi:hypothetical protein|nr:hypothetical protein [Candidatus Solibacter sp.]